MGTSITPVKSEGVDRNRAVLVDGQSILACCNWEMEQWDKRTGSQEDFERQGFLNLVQNLVIYEEVLVDSQLLAVNNECRKTCEFFPTIFRALRIPGTVRNQLASLLSGLKLGDVIPIGTVAPAEELCELVRGDSEGSEHYQLTSRYREDVPETSWLGTDLEEYEWTLPQGKLEQTGMSFLRAHFYLELARALHLFLSPHPMRAEYFKRITRPEVALPERIVSEVDRKLRENEFTRIDIRVPPVAELVLRTSMKKRVDLVTATLEVRESKNAQRFREWCSKMSAELAASPGRAGLAKAQEVKRELDKVCAVWQADIDEDVRYKRRQLDLGTIPLVGAVLTFGGMQKLTVKDRVLIADKPYLLLLNDLYQP